MWLLLLEAGAAASILVLIVWWTIPSAKKPTRPTAQKTLPPKDGPH